MKYLTFAWLSCDLRREKVKFICWGIRPEIISCHWQKENEWAKTNSRYLSRFPSCAKVNKRISAKIFFWGRKKEINFVFLLNLDFLILTLSQVILTWPTFLRTRKKNKEGGRERTKEEREGEREWKKRERERYGKRKRNKRERERERGNKTFKIFCH